MGLSVAIGGSMAVITLVMSLSMFPMMIEDIHDVGITNSEISQSKKQFDKTNLQISSINGEIGEDQFNFILTNTGSEKLYDYENFEIFVTYDGNVSGSKVRLTEQFTYNETGSFLPPPPPWTYARPASDILVGSWTDEPLFEKIDEKTRDDGDFILSPLLSSSPANDVEVKLSSMEDPKIPSGHIVRYAFRTSDVVDSKAMVMYGNSSTPIALYRTWANSTEFSDELLANNVDDTIISAQLKASPNSIEKLLVTLDDSDFLHVQTWDGTTWTSNWNVELNKPNTLLSVYDVAYESISGDAIVVFGEDSDQLQYRKRVDGVWDSTNQNFNFTITDVPNLILAEPNPTNDDIFLGVLTDAQTMEAVRWNGNTDSWENKIITTAGPSENEDWVFDWAFERNSGDAFLLWGDQNRNLQYKEFTTEWKAESIAYTFTSNVRIVSAGYDQDPTSNKIAVGMIQNNRLEFGAWDGNQWVTNPPNIPTSATKKLIDVDFEKSTGEALFSFTRGGNPQQKMLSWRTWDSGSGFSAVTTEPGQVGTIRNIELFSDPLTDNVMVLYSDTGNDLFHRKWNGTSFSPLESALTLNLANRDSPSFSFAWNQFLVYSLTVQLRQGDTVIAQWEEGNPFGLTNYIQRDWTLSFDEANSITNYSDTRIRFKIADGQFEWSWAEFFIGLPRPSPGVNMWIIDEISLEILDPLVLNPNESAIIYGELQYPVYPNGLISVTVISSNGVAATNSTVLVPPVVG